ncbi:unnamed protein product [Triticum turgidum subsp. durum]|uniref:Uncharacterized protein n=1 Tax=Triticum turgidum subsp. durum TaxID=4567 RepID=A0A9R1NJZ9_TRITD|nr:unnamed protein product [Triticum turgidum subsp. durum]
MIGFFSKGGMPPESSGIASFRKVTTALRMLAYGIPADLVDDHLAMGESQAIMCVKRFAVAIAQVFGQEYLRYPNAEDAARLLEMNKHRHISNTNGRTYNYGYYLADDIYPKWQTFVKPLKKLEERWLSSYDNAKEDTYAYAHSTYGSYDASYGQSYSVDAVSDEPTWFPNQSYQDVYREEEPRYQEVLPSYGIESTFSSQPIYCYNQHTGEQSLHVQVEPPETFYSHKLEYHENFSTYTNHIDNSEISTQSCEIQPYAYVPDSPVEAYQPSWSMNLGYYQDSAEEVTPQYDNDAFGSGEYGGMASIFSSSSYPQQVEVYEQSYGDENVSLEQNFQSNWNAFSEDTSGITKSTYCALEPFTDMFTGYLFRFEQYHKNASSKLLLAVDFHFVLCI